MFIQPWDAGLDAAEWQTWIAGGHDFGLLSVNGLPGLLHDGGDETAVAIRGLDDTGVGG